MNRISRDDCGDDEKFLEKFWNFNICVIELSQRIQFIGTFCAQRQVDRHQVFALLFATTQGLGMKINTSCIQINFNNNEKHLSEAENMKNVHYTTMTSEIFEESWIYIVVTVNRKFFLRSEEKIEWNASIELCHEFVKRQKAALTSHGDFFAPERIL